MSASQNYSKNSFFFYFVIHFTPFVIRMNSPVPLIWMTILLLSFSPLKSQTNSPYPAKYERLFHRLDDRDWRSRDLATRSLIAIGPPALPHIQKALKEDLSLEVRWRLRYIRREIKSHQLGHYGVVNWLIKEIRNEGQRWKSSHFRALVQMGQKAQQPLLQVLLDSERDSTAKIIALRALRKIDGKEIFSALKEAFFQLDLKVLYEWGDTAFALHPEKTRNFLFQQLQKSEKNQLKAAYILSFRRDLKNQQIKKALLKASHSPSREVRNFAIRALSRYEDSDVDRRLAQALSDPAPTVRLSAILALTIEPKNSNRQIYLQLLEHKSPLYVKSALQALGKIGATEAVDQIRPFLNHRHSLVRQAAIEAVGKIKDEESLPQLIDFLDSKSLAIKLEAIRALGELSSPRALPPLIKVSRHKEPLVRQTALEALSHYSNALVIKRLVRALEDDEIGVRNQAVESLRKVTNRYFGYGKDRSLEKRQEALERWRQWWRDYSGKRKPRKGKE